MKDTKLWSLFCQKYGVASKNWEAWAFDGDPDTLADLVMRGIKTGTSSSYDLSILEKEPLPQSGSYSVILDSKGNAKCIIETTKVYIVPFCEVSPSHAYKEGEGDRSLSHWREVHKAFFTQRLQAYGIPFTQDSRIICEEFRLVFVP